MSSGKVWVVDEPWLERKCVFGEGPFYESETNSLRFVDVKEKRIYSVCLSDGIDSRTPVQLDIVATVTCDIRNVDPRNRFLIGVKYGMAVLDTTTSSIKLIAPFHEPSNKRLRSNDGAADPHGRFWLGSMTDFDQGEVLAEGSLWCFSRNGKEEVERDISIPNSIGWSPDMKTLYWVDSKNRRIFTRDYDLETGTTSNQRVFYIHQGTGEPDGFRVDVEGNLWLAVFGESRVVRIGPNGRLVGEIHFPTRFITCVEFAGTELFITSAADDSGDERSQRYGGSVFRLDVGITGLDRFKYNM